MAKNKLMERRAVEEEAQRLRLILIDALPIGSDYAAVLMALAEAQKDFVFLWLAASPTSRR